MSKYKQRGAYHYGEFNEDTPYRAHVLDLVEQIGKKVSKELLLPKVIEIGAGEGLILAQLTKTHGFDCEGCDIDVTAVELAKVWKNRVHLGSVEVFKGRDAVDVVLLCDVLEHVQDPMEMLDWAGVMSTLVVVAIPDRPDPHAVNKVCDDPDSIVCYMDAIGFDCTYQARRHARHLMIFESR